MPYEWIDTEEGAAARSAAPSPAPRPLARLHLWPYRSLTPRGFVWFIAVTMALITLPLVSVLGTPVMWGLLPFALMALGGVWWALQRNLRDAQVIEDLTIWPDCVTLARHGPRGRRQTWEANPHWVQVVLHPEDGPVPNYLTLRGGPREVEIGAFLSEEERLALRTEVQRALARAR